MKKKNLKDNYFWKIYKKIWFLIIIYFKGNDKKKNHQKMELEFAQHVAEKNFYKKYGFL